MANRRTRPLLHALHRHIGPLGERNWGEMCLTRRRLMPTLFFMHRQLTAGEVGKIVIGVSSLLLLLIPFSGVILWWPTFTRKDWSQALRGSHLGAWPRSRVTMRRTAGVIVAPILIMQRFVGWSFNLPDWVRPVVGSVMTLSPTGKPVNKAVPSAAVADKPSAYLWPSQAMPVAQSAYSAMRVSRIALPANPAMPFEARVRQGCEVRRGAGATRITIGAWGGSTLRAIDPFPFRNPAGDTFLCTPAKPAAWQGASSSALPAWFRCCSVSRGLLCGCDAGGKNAPEKNKNVLSMAATLARAAALLEAQRVAFPKEDVSGTFLP